MIVSIPPECAMMGIISATYIAVFKWRNYGSATEGPAHHDRLILCALNANQVKMKKEQAHEPNHRHVHAGERP